MSILGAYPFSVFVTNIFGPDSKTVINVKHYHHPTYYDKETKSYKIENIPADHNKINEYSVQNGHKIGFPMYLGDEHLEISLGGPHPDFYSIQVGEKAGCLLYAPDGSSIQPTIPTDAGAKTGDNGHLFYYKGGTWIFPSIPGQPGKWTLKIMKFRFDPEDENVVIGPGTPG